MTAETEPQPSGDQVYMPAPSVQPPGQAAEREADAGSGTTSTSGHGERGGRIMVERSQEDLPRMLLWWCLWLLGSWLVIRKVEGLHLRLLPPHGLLSPAGPPESRRMMFACLLGLMLLWPALRLSQCPSRGRGARPVEARRVSRVLLDWLGMVLLVQVVIWPLQQMGDWTRLQTAWIATMIGAWSLLTAVIVAWGMLGERGTRRTVAMALCTALIFGEPMLMWLVTAMGGPSWFMSVSPIQTMWALTTNRVDFALYPAVWHVTAAAAAALVAWVIMLVQVARRN